MDVEDVCGAGYTQSGSFGFAYGRVMRACTRCLPDRSPKPKSCRSMLPETAEAPFESDTDGDRSFQSFELGGRWESAMSF